MPKMARMRRAEPETPIERLLEQIRQNLHLPEPGAFYAVMGTMAANMIQGVPVWSMLVGPPSCGGTELLNLLDDIPGVIGGGGVEGRAAFLSGSPSKDQTSQSTGGLLKEIGSHGAMLFKDFTEIVSLPEPKYHEVMGVLRRVYDGEWDRPLGTDGGKRLYWRGRAAILGKTTGAIDAHLPATAALGERWLYYRYPKDDQDYEKTRRSMLNANRSSWKSNLAVIVYNFFALEMELEFGKTQPRRDPTDAEMNRVSCIGMLAARCRSSVNRDARTKEALGCHDTEAATRVTNALVQLLLGLEYIGVREKERWELVCKMALDSMPLMRQKVFFSALKADKEIGRILNNGKQTDSNGAINQTELLKIAQSGEGVLSRTIEDLEVQGVVRQERVRGEGNWVQITALARDLYKKGWVR